MNPFDLLKIKPAINAFCSRHAPFVKFLSYASTHMQEDSLLEVTLTGPDGQPAKTNLRVTAEDVALIAQMGEMLGKMK